jgi:MFS transporter, Spinster family, sphingosine-1-phosphate transporter
MSTAANDALTRAANPTGLLVALTALNILNFADRYLIIAFSPRIVPELKLTNLQFGLLTGIVFTLTYTLVGLYLGSLADRVHRPRLIAAGIAVWSALTAATGLARSFAQMAVARMFVGVGEASLTPAALSLLSESFAPGRRAFANGVYYLGIPVGIGGSFMLAGWLGPLLGWRGSFIALGVLGLVASLLVAWLMRDPRRASETAAGAAVVVPRSFAASFAGISHEIRHNRAFTLTLLGCIAATIVQGAAVLDLLWWVRERGFSEPAAQKVVGALFLAGGVVGAIGGGYVADLVNRRVACGRLKFLAWTFLLGIPLMLTFRYTPAASAFFLPLAFVGNVIFMMVYGPALATLQEQVPAMHRASAVALFVLVTSLVGAGGGAALVGFLADRFTASGSATPLTFAIVATQAIGFFAVPAFGFAARAQARASDAAR